MNNWMALIAGGIVGTAARYAFSGFMMHRLGMNFPWGTLCVNMLGCFLVGFLDVFIERKFSVPSALRLLMVAGFCGAFTTFSTYILEGYALIKSGAMMKAVGYLGGSVCLGLIMFRLGMLFAESM